jgi:phosphotriesterase-related protein
MPGISTVRGRIDVASVGQTLMHEHIFILSPEHVESYGHGAWWDEEQQISTAVATLGSLASKGVNTIVDMTVLGLGRSIPRIQRIAAQVPGLNIIVATGIYALEAVPLQYVHRGPGRRVDIPEPMVDDFCRDITVGIGESGVRAGMLKCVVEAQGLTPGTERICRAVAAAHLRTGVPITVHTNAAAGTGLLALALFAQEGVDLSKVIIGHAGDSNDVDFLMRLADSGATLGMDRFGFHTYNTTVARVETIAKLCDRGYADRMVLSHDTACFADLYGDSWSDVMKTLPDWRYDHIHNHVLPALMEAGVRRDQVEAMLVGNPRRLLSRPD